MKRGSEDESILAALSPRDVAGWLRGQGFTHAGAFGEYGAVFSKKTELEEQEVILPNTPSARDFTRRMAELVDEIARIYDRPSHDVLTDLTLAPFDVVKVRSPDADDYGSIPLPTGLDLHEEARNLVLAAANAAASPLPRRSWRGRRFEEVGAYLENVRLGQSQRGSFVLTLLSPWDFTTDTNRSLDFGQATFGRRVTLALARALRATETAMRETVAGSVSPLVEAYRHGVTSNFCLALAKLAREGGGIDVSIVWSPAQPEGESVGIRLKREDASVLTEAAKELSRQEPEPDVSLEGLVAAITEEPERFDGSAVLETNVLGGVRRVRIQFGGPERRLIYDAARDKKWVRVVGDLQREGRRLTLMNPRDISVIEVEDVDAI
jgi:hypothetical protein